MEGQQRYPGTNQSILRAINQSKGLKEARIETLAPADHVPRKKPQKLHTV
jgi:hypothetical protein